MSIIKTFTETDSIRRALEIITDYPFEERPKLFIRYDTNIRYVRDWYEGTLISFSGRIVTIRELCIGFKLVWLNKITELCVFDEKEGDFT